MLSLGSCGWIQDRHNLLITGPTGHRQDLPGLRLRRTRLPPWLHRPLRARLPRLLHELAVGRGDGSYTRLLARLAKLDLLAIDDWLLAPLRDAERRDLLEVIEDRYERASTLIASQLPVKDWHGGIGDPNLADAICDRLLHNAHRIELKGPSMRRTKAAPKITGEAKSNDQRRFAPTRSTGGTHGSSDVPIVDPGAILEARLRAEARGSCRSRGKRLRTPTKQPLIPGVSHRSLDGATRRPQAPQAKPSLSLAGESDVRSTERNAEKRRPLRQSSLRSDGDHDQRNP